MPSKIPSNIHSFIVPQKFQQLTQEANSCTALQCALSPIECDLAMQTQRNAATITVVTQKSPANMPYLHPAEPVRFSQRKTLTFYRDDTNEYSIEYKPEQSGLYFLSSFYHEAEHAAQAYGNTYSPDERRMCNICKTLYDYSGNSIEYRNNYAELKARMAEAEFAIQAYAILQKEHAVDALSDEIILFLVAKHNELILGVSQEHIQQVLQQQQNQLTAMKHHVTGEDVSRLMREFHTHPKRCIALSQRFLKQNGEQLYQQVYRETIATAQRLQTLIEKCKTEKEAVNDKHVDTTGMGDILAQQIVLHTLPQPEPSLRFPVKNANELQSALQLASQWNNVAVYVTPQNNVWVVADKLQIPRPYSSDPQLRAQWEQEHPEALEAPRDEISNEEEQIE